jgi:hypothetical protein
MSCQSAGSRALEIIEKIREFVVDTNIVLHVSQQRKFYKPEPGDKMGVIPASHVADSFFYLQKIRRKRNGFERILKEIK